MSNSTGAARPWDIEAARNLYNIQRWGAKYFDINDEGHVVARPLQDAGVAVDITDVIEEAKGRGLKFPLLIRFQDILRHRVESLNQSFRNALAEYGYRGQYRGVFPIKVNQLREVVEEILDAGKPFDFGLEVGSKAELLAGLALQNQIGSLIVCNGYKDAEFIKMAMLGIKLGKTVILVVEKLEELRHIIAISKQLNVEPLLGVRARLVSRGAGRWASSGGENAKFGLSTAELLEATEMLKAENLGHCFKHLKAIIEGSSFRERFGVCFDTCHAFAAGYRIAEKDGFLRTFEELDAAVGLPALLAFHLNDSKKGLGCRVDRHEHIGAGALGLEAFRFIMNEPRFALVPKFIETPKGDDDEMDLVNLRLLRSLVDARGQEIASLQSEASKAPTTPSRKS